MSELYIVISRTHTRFGSVIRMVTGAEYNHASLAFHEDLTDLISMTRKRLDDPSSAQLTRESTERFVAGGHADAKILLYKIEITDEQEENIKQFIESVASNEDVKYNLFSALTYPVLKGFSTKDAYTCSEFVAKVLKHTDIEIVKNPCKVLPQHLVEELDEYMIFDGGIIDWAGSHNVCEDHYDVTTPKHKMAASLATQCVQLAYRDIIGLKNKIMP